MTKFLKTARAFTNMYTKHRQSHKNSKNTNARSIIKGVANVLKTIVPLKFKPIVAVGEKIADELALNDFSIKKLGNHAKQSIAQFIINKGPEIVNDNLLKLFQ